ncbi:hypothetical protein F4777DRAFT_346540 [Nemania sp. FL0916]|nr:hypothetical protein F4777DRAFT_346540 [Nemania sp. FL0916]
MNHFQTTRLSSHRSLAMLRHRPLLVAGLVFTGLGVAGIQYKRTAIARNERAQREGREPNFYVSVERSGGGI